MMKKILLTSGGFDNKNIAEVILAKNRAGQTGTTELVWLGNYLKFGNIDKFH